MRHGAGWVKTPRSFPTTLPHYPRQAFHHPRTSLGAAGHWVNLAAVTAPLLIGECVKDRDQRWRALRLASVGVAITSEALWTYKLAQERKRDEANRAALEDCASHDR